MKSYRRVAEAFFWLLLSLLTLLAVAVHTSPVYPILKGDLSETVSASMLAGRCFGEGMIPYRDLFLIKGPVYLAIQTAGWKIAGRTGIFILEIVHFAAFLMLLHQMLRLYTKSRISWILTVCAVFPFIVMCDGGNTSREWCLVSVTAVFYLLLRQFTQEQHTRRRMFWLGFCTAVAILTDAAGGILAVLCAIGGVWLLVRQKKETVRSLILCPFAGAAIPCGITVLYFAVNGCGMLWFEGAIWCFLIKLVKEGYTFEILMHKVCKAMLIASLVLAVLLAWKRSKEEIVQQTKALLAVFSAAGVIYLLLVELSWFSYMLIIPLSLLGMVLFWNLDWKQSKACMAGCLLLCLAICAIPMKSYYHYLTGGVSEGMRLFYEDLKQYCEDAPEAVIMCQDLDYSPYLALGLRPNCCFFTDTELLYENLAAAKQEIDAYRNGETPVDILLTMEKDWHGQDLELFDLVQVYLKTRGNYCIYLPRK